MRQRYQVILHGTGFSVPVDDSKPICGFYIIRRVLADGLADAKQNAINAVKREEKYQTLLEMTEASSGSQEHCRLQIDSIGRLPWWRWYFSKYSPSFIFYSDETDESE